MSFFKRVIGTFFYILLWIVIANSGGKVNLDELIPYYFIAAGMAEVNMSYYGKFGKAIGQAIKRGELNSILIKPVNSLLYIFFRSIGENGVRVIMGALMIFVGLLINRNLTIRQLLLFIIFLLISFAVSFAFNVLEGVIFFYVPEAGGFRSTLNHIKNLLGGLMVPLYVFPEFIENVVAFLPFASLVYYPSLVLSSNPPINELYLYLLAGLFWAIILNIIVFSLWNKSLKTYEAIGI